MQLAGQPCSGALLTAPAAVPVLALLPGFSKAYGRSGSSIVTAARRTACPLQSADNGMLTMLQQVPASTQ